MSSYIATLTAIAIAKRTVPRQGEGLTYENLAILKLKKREQIQGSLCIITALASMYLFSVLGVKGKQNDLTWWLGLLGMMSLLIAIIIEGTFLVSLRSRREQGFTTAKSRVDSTESEMELATTNTTLKFKKQFSVGRLGDEMVVAGMV